MYAVGVDVGASYTKVGLVNDAGQLVAKRVVPTDKEKGFGHLLDVLEEAIWSLEQERGLADRHIQGIGVGLPAFLDGNGFLHEAVNLGWRRIAVLETLSSRFPWPVRVDNDANLAALAEYWQGNGQGKDPFICLTLGTGVGGGVIVRGRLLHGSSYMAGEIGHLPVSPRHWPCRCGNTGCLETVSSATGMLRLAREGLAQGFNSFLNSETLTVEALFRAAQQGDELALAVLEEAGAALAEALAMVSVVLNPERIVLGGGVMHVAGAWHQAIAKKLYVRGLSRAVAHVEVLPARLLNDAGMIGAAALFFHAKED